MNCRLCEREAVKELCPYHEKARQEVEAAYPLWKEAYGGIGWGEYLSRIIRHPETGQWAVEAARLMKDLSEGRTTRTSP
ncbi:MAG TPA: hypothetical protein VLY21_04035 [Nitrososphaerales archaeon]|nr:hypothetical protein [Nitrososphaerales archaeon]